MTCAHYLLRMCPRSNVNHLHKFVFSNLKSAFHPMMNLGVVRPSITSLALIREALVSLLINDVYRVVLTAYAAYVYAAYNYVSNFKSIYNRKNTFVVRIMLEEAPLRLMNCDNVQLCDCQLAGHSCVQISITCKDRFNNLCPTPRKIYSCAQLVLDNDLSLNGVICFNLLPELGDTSEWTKSQVHEVNDRLSFLRPKY